MSARVEQENALIGDIASFRDDPLGFVRYAFPWADGEGPDDWQREQLAEIGETVRSAEAATLFANATGHGVGKTTFAAWLVLWAMSTRPHLAGVVTANTQAQLRDKTWRELAKWHKLAINSHWFKQTATHFYQVDHPETWFVAAVPWSKERPEAFAGLHAEDVLVIYDEASAIDDVIWETTEGAMTTPGAMWFAFGNPTRNTGRFRECFGKYRHRWCGRSVDARSAKMANPKQIAQWREDYGEDSDFFRVRVKGEFPSASSCQLIPADVVDAAMARQFPLDAVRHFPRVWGVDIARYGDDATVVFERQGRAAKILHEARHRDLMAIANWLAHHWRETAPDAVFIDDGGVGGGVTDRLRELGFAPIAVNFASRARDAENYANIRAQMWFEMAEWLKDASIPDNPRLRDDLIGPEYAFTAGGERRQLESKDDMKRRGLASPDLGDALALTFAMPVRKASAAPRQNTYAANFDPYAGLRRR